MGREDWLDQFQWLLISRPRRLTIGDLMIGVALAALGCFTLTVTLHSQLSGGERAAFGILALVLFAMQAAQWRLASIPTHRMRSGMNTLLGIVSCLVALSTFVCLFILAAAFPEGAALVVVAMLVLVVYLTTWD